MSYQKYTVKKILQSAFEPTDKEWLWLTVADGKPVLRQHVNGKWADIGVVASIDQQDTPAPSTPSTPSTPQDMSMYVTTTYLNSRLSGFVNTEYVNTTVSAAVDSVLSTMSMRYVRSESFESHVNNMMAVLNSHTDAINGLGDDVDNIPNLYQTKLTAGTGISIDNGVISCTVESGGGGTPGVGIDRISTDESAEDGGVNTITFYLTDGTQQEFSVRNGSQGDDGYSSEGGIAGRGPLTGTGSATAYATAHPNTLFQWILDVTTQHGASTVNIVKPIWCTGVSNGNPVFVDAVGSVISDT